MLENKDIDQLFKDELTRTIPFDNEDRQWETVAARLKQKPKNKFFLLFFLIPVLLFGMYTVNNVSSDSGLSEKESTYSEVTEKESKASYIANDANQSTDSPASLTVSEPAENTSNQTLLNPEPSEENTKNISTQIFENDLESKNSKSSLQESNSEFKNYSKNQTNAIEYSASTEDVERKENVTNNYTNELNSAAKRSKSLAPKTEIPLDRNSLEALSFLPIKNHVLSNSNTLNHPYPDPIIVEVSSNQALALSISAGLFSEHLFTDSLRNNNTLGWSVGLAAELSRIRFTLGYKHLNINRTITSDPREYNLEDSNFIYSYEKPDSVNISYTNHYIDLTAAYDVLSFKRADLSLSAGLQSRIIVQDSLQFTYGGVYNPIVNELQLPSNNIILSNLRFGTGIRYKVFPKFSLGMNYHITLPLDISSLKWPVRHQFEFGAHYLIH